MSDLADLLSLNGEYGREPGTTSLGGFVQGVVTDNGDKKFPGMVKVEYTAWTSGKNISQWVPVLQGYAGADYGSYTVPEVDDIVLLGFIGANRERPFVLGSFYPAEAAMVKESFTAKNENKRLLTKGGSEVVIVETDGKQSITIKTPGGLQVTMGDEKKNIAVSDKNGQNQLTLDCQNGAITLKAKKKITIQAGSSSISLDGQSGAVKISCKTLDISAQQQGKISAMQQLEVSGGMLKVQGNQTAQISGGVMTEVKGAVVKIN